MKGLGSRHFRQGTHEVQAPGNQEENLKSNSSPDLDKHACPNGLSCLLFLIVLRIHTPFSRLSLRSSISLHTDLLHTLVELSGPSEDKQKRFGELIAHVVGSASQDTAPLDQRRVTGMRRRVSQDFTRGL